MNFLRSCFIVKAKTVPSCDVSSMCTEEILKLFLFKSGRIEEPKWKQDFLLDEVIEMMIPVNWVMYTCILH